MDQAIFSLGIALFATALLVQAGMGKLKAPHRYVETVSAYLGVRANALLVMAVGVLELAIALLLLLPLSRSMGGLLAGGLMLVYAGAMVRQLAAGRRDLRCGCSGPAADTRVGTELVIRNVVIALPMLALAFSEHGMGSVPELLVGAAWGALLVLCYAATDQLISNRQKLQGWR